MRRVRKESGAVDDGVDAIHGRAHARGILNVADSDVLRRQREPSRIVLRADQSADVESVLTAGRQRFGGRRLPPRP